MAKSKLESSISEAAGNFVDRIVDAVKQATLQELIGMKGAVIPSVSKSGKTAAQASDEASPRKKRVHNYPKCAYKGCNKNRFARGEGFCGEHWHMLKEGKIKPANEQDTAASESDDVAKKTTSSRKGTPKKNVQKKTAVGKKKSGKKTAPKKASRKPIAKRSPAKKAAKKAPAKKAVTKKVTKKSATKRAAKKPLKANIKKRTTKPSASKHVLKKKIQKKSSAKKKIAAKKTSKKARQKK